MTAQPALRETLKQHRLKDGESRRRTAVSRLPRNLRATAWQLLGYDSRGKPFALDRWEARSKAQEQAVQTLETISPAERLNIFQALLPQLAPYVEAGWQLQKQFPYRVDGQRRAFRVPHRPDLTLSRRGNWLLSISHLTRDYDEDITWWAQWAAHLEGGYWGNQLGILFAAAIEMGDPPGNEVFEILMASARGEHDIGMMGRHVIQGLLSASRPEGWTLVEQLLLAAQRQEGLRQVILETVDEAQPEAFRRMVSLLHRENLARFSSVVRAIDVWFGFGWEAANTRVVNQLLAELDDLLAAETACLAALQSEQAQTVYLALCSLAFADAEQTVPHAKTLLGHPNLEHRFITTYFLAQLKLPQTDEILVPLIADSDLRIASTAFNGISSNYLRRSSPPDLFETLEVALPHFPPKEKTLEPLVWPWLTITAHQQQLANALGAARGKRPLERIRPYLKLMDPWQRARIAQDLQTDHEQGDPAARELLLEFLGDRSRAVRQQALETAEKLKLTSAEAQQLESYLTRKAGDLRRGLLNLLLGQPDSAALASAQRLLEAKHPQQRQGGLELLQQLKKQQRSVKKCQTLAQAYAAADEASGVEQTLLAALVEGQQKAATLEDGLGLFDPAQRTQAPAPQSKKGWLKKFALVSSSAKACLKSLDDLIHTRRETSIKLKWWHGEGEELLGNIRGGFPSPDANQPPDQDLSRLPLADLWFQWAAERPANMRDEDGLELLRALAPLSAGPAHLLPSFLFGRAVATPLWLKKAVSDLYGNMNVQKLQYSFIIDAILWWLVRHEPPANAVDYLLDAVEHSFSLIKVKPEPEPDWRHHQGLRGWLNLTREHRKLCPGDWTEAHHIRLWHLLRWLDEPGGQVSRLRPQLDEVMRARHAGEATEADLLDQLIGPREVHRDYYGLGSDFNDLRHLSARKPNPRYSQFATDAELQTLVERCRRRIIEVELQRGDLPTAVSTPAMALRYSGGLETLLHLLAAFGKEPFLRGWAYDSASKKTVFSHLIRSTFPARTETPEQFARQVKQIKIGQQRLIETAIYAPQWAGHIEHTLGWPQFAEAVWWFHAHTKDQRWQIDQEIRQTWEAEVNERTALSGQALIDGAVDVAWFHRVYAALGEERWGKLHGAAKYASGGGGHKRAQLFAEAMLGRVDQATLMQRMAGKRHQDAVRALGLLPLPDDNTRDDVILQRYELIQEFVWGSRKFGSQRQASEKLAAKIGLENLARTAGFPDPLRLEWAMEAHAVADLAAGPVTVTVEAVTVTLAIDDWGEPQLSIRKNGRALKSVPAKLKKQPDIATLVTRRREIKRQAARMRQSLEQAMCRGDVFSGAELAGLLQHPVLNPLLTQLVFAGDNSIGYPVGDGSALIDANGEAHPIAPDTLVRIAHPHDLLQTGAWHTWQNECFRHERIQPFKQVFRELYVLTAVEKEDNTVSHRYEGHQVNPRQAVALLGQRGWVSHPEEGVRRTFHTEGLTVWLTFLQGYFTPADVEGLTLEGVYFARRGEWQPLPLAEIPARLFSEVMRDLDLVVSVAHQGGVDPETTASTVEMRAALIRETCAMLKIDNIRLKSNHVLVDGELNNYSVHLGSGVVHQQPGGYVCIVPVHSQHRGRIFLPFADDDPKTAEVVSKVLLLARDKQIKDPTILEQILPKK